MKKKSVALAVWALVSTGAAGEPKGLSMSQIREAVIESGFTSLNSDGSDIDIGDGYILKALLGNARLESRRIVFRADRILFIYYTKEQKLGVTHPFEIYAEGNVVVAPGPAHGLGMRPYLMADALYYDGRTLQGLAVNVTLRVVNVTALMGPSVPRNLAVVAQELRFRGKADEVKKKSAKAKVGFHYFQGKEITVSTCDLALPHWGLKCEKLEAFREEEDDGESEEPSSEAAGAAVKLAAAATEQDPAAAAGGPPRDEPAEDRENGGREYTIRTQGQWGALFGHRILPLPPAQLSTRYFRSLPLTQFQIENSRKFGYGARTTWSLNRVPGIGNALRSFRRATGVPAYVDFQLDYLSSRGVGLGTEVSYGRRPSRWREPSWTNVRGDIRFYGIHDEGEDRNQDELYPGHPPSEWRTEDRFRLRGFHRSTLPVIGSLDGEISYWRDRNFYKEFFESELYSERNPNNPETYLLWRRPFGEDVVGSVLFRPRVNDFQSYNERLPEGTVELFPWHIGESIGPTVQGELRAGNLRHLPDDFVADTEDSFRTGRYHGEGTVALPLGAGRYVRVRPYYSLKETIYENRWQMPGGAQRLVQVAGASAATQFWRNYPLESSFLGTRVIRHVVVPQVSYSYAFYSNHDRDEFYQFDSIDSLDVLEYLELELATYLLGLRNGMTPAAEGAIRRLIELRTRVRYFPRPGRDNVVGGEAESFSNVNLDIFSDILHPYLTAGVESEIDTTAGKGFVVLDPYVTLALPGKFTLSAGELFIREDQARGLAKSNYFWSNLAWFLSENYTVHAYFRYDFANDTVSQQSLTVGRKFHCLTVETGVEYDNGDNEVMWTVRAYPTGLSRKDGQQP